MPEPQDKDRDRGGQSSSRAAAAELAKAPAPARPTAARQGPGGRPAAASAPQAPQVDPAMVAAATAAAVTAIDKHRAATMGSPDMDKTIPGGVYIVDGQVVDANGEPRELPEEAPPEDEAPDQPVPLREP